MSEYIVKVRRQIVDEVTVQADSPSEAARVAHRIQTRFADSRPDIYEELAEFYDVTYFEVEIDTDVKEIIDETDERHRTDDYDHQKEY